MQSALQEAQRLARGGRREDAVAYLERVVAEHPEARDPRLMLARLLNELGSVARAEAHASSLTRRDPRDPEAWCALGFALQSLGRPRQAAAALEQAVSLKSGYGVAHRNLAAVYCDQERSEAAIAAATQARLHGVTPAVTDRIIARALIQLDELAQAETLLRTQLAAVPADAQSLRLLSQLRHLRGDDDPLSELRAAAHATGAAPALRLTLADLLRRRGELEASETELRQLLGQCGPMPELLTALAIVLQERGDWSQALTHARAALRGGEPSVAMAECFVVSCIGGGAAADALPLVEQMRARFPLDQRWITHRIDLARLRGEDGFESWYAPSRVTQVFQLADAGFLSTLRELLENRHRHRGHPLEHSIRQGTQTSRNLLVDPEPPLARLFEWFGDCLRQYVQRLSADLPAAERAAHPVLARASSAPRPVGCWSVRLGRGGYHVNHIHPEGWLSSAFYVQVPEEAADVTRKAGWLKFGEPGQATSVLPPLGHVQPSPGRLVLFPSYLWHGTNALRDDAVRLSIAFDAAPESELR
jgi:uncharacterized protein (TIGR02466 family)